MPKPIPEFVSHVLDTMRQTTAIGAKSMFGGWGLSHDGVMVGLIADDVLYLKVDATSKSDFAAIGSSPFTYLGKGKPVQMSYWRAPEEALESPQEMRHWLRLAIAAALRARASAPVKKASERPPTRKRATAKRTGEKPFARKSKLSGP